MKKFLFSIAFAFTTICANAQFTYYNPVRVENGRSGSSSSGGSYYNNSDAPFTYYQSTIPELRDRTPQRQPETVQDVMAYLVKNNDVKRQKIRVASDGYSVRVKAYYSSYNNTWVNNSAKAEALTINDPRELRELFSYKAYIMNLGYVYF